MAVSVSRAIAAGPDVLLTSLANMLRAAPEMREVATRRPHPFCRPDPEVSMSTIGSAVRETGISLSTVFRQPALRRLNLALAGSMIGDWAYATAIAVWAYGIGGASAVGIWATCRLALMAVLAPFAAAMADRYPRRTVMIACDLARFVLVGAAATVVQADGPAAVVFVLATLSPIFGTAFRPAQMAMTPSLVRTPDELTAANGVASTVESLAFFVGPALAAFLLAVADVASVFAVNALTFALSAVIVSGIRPPKTADAPVPVTPAGEAVGTDPDAVETAAEGTKPNFLVDALEGFRVIWRHPDLRLVVTTYCAQTVVAGAMAVFVVAIAFDMTDLGASGLGWLDSVLGVGAIFGGFLAIGLAARRHLASDFGWGVVFWAVPLLLVAVWPTAVAAFIAMAIIGAANPVVDVNASTILQRLTPDAVMARVFGALESGLIGTMALGALVMPLLIAGPGLRWGLVILSVPIAVIALLGMSRLRKLDHTVSEPEGVALLAGVPLFAPLARPLLESLAGKLTRIEVPAGTDVVRVGETGDLFYVIESGRLEATYDGRELSSMGPGECFGEIALLRDVPRTATVTAQEDSVLQALDREDFLAAMSGDTELLGRTESMAARRIQTV
jgi:MFS family permease